MLEVYQLRQLVAAKIEAELGGAGWHESRIHYDRFGLSGDSHSYAAHAFAVGIPRTSFDSPNETSRTKRSITQGGYVVSEVRVRWLAQVRADAQVEDLDAALEDEFDVLDAVLNVSRTDGLHLSAVAVERRSVGDGTWLLHELVLIARHQVAIRE